jgi:hypothetical protein
MGLEPRKTAILEPTNVSVRRDRAGVWGIAAASWENPVPEGSMLSRFAKEYRNIGQRNNQIFRLRDFTKT